MATHERPSGVRIEVPDDVTIEDPTGRSGKRGSRLPTGPVPLRGGSSVGPESDPVVGAMRDQDLVLVDTFAVVPAAGAPKRRVPAPSRLTVDVGDNEDSVVLFEQDGIYAWRYPERSETVPPPIARRGAVRVRPRRRVTFDLSVEPTPESAARRKRGPIADFVIGRVRTYVFRFVARVAVGSAVEFLERKKRTGLVRMDADDPSKWSPFERLDALALPSDRPARILLFVHGTFSSTLGSYGALGVSAWGRDFLARARRSYDAVIGYDHRTLSADPLQNAHDLLGRLEQTTAPSLDIDAVAFSRGGLVLRSLIEYLLPSASLRARVRRAVFVGATNGGTQLAAPENWRRLVDLSTNLVAVGCRALSAFAPATLATTIVRESVDTLGALVKVLAAELANEDTVPGLAAMVPTGRFVTEINKIQEGQPQAADSLYYVVSSEFDVDGVASGGGAPEFPQRLARWAADAIVDAAMREPNDLVVNTASMSAIDADWGVFVKDRWHFARNLHVYHTIYFTRDEVVRALNRWFGLDAAASLPPDAGAIPAGADDRIIVVAADAPFAATLDAIRTSTPTFVVAQRTAPDGMRYRYAFRSEELLTLGAKATARSLEDVVRATPFEMHEETSTPEAAPGSLHTAGLNIGATGQRLIVQTGDVPRAVIDRGTALASSTELADVTRRIVVPRTTPATPAAASRRRGAPALTDRRRMRRGSGAIPRPPGGGGGSRWGVAYKQSDVRSGARPGLPPASRPPAPRAFRSPTARGRVDDSVLGKIARRRSMPAPARVTPKAAPRTGTLFIGGDMPETVPVGVTVALNVVVSRDEIVVTAGPTRASGRAKVALDSTVLVQVIAKKNVVVEGADRADIDPSTARTELVFDVTGVAPGSGELWVLLRQGPIVLVTLKLEPEVVGRAAQPAAARLRSAAEAQPADAAVVSYPVLQIFEWQGGSAFKYHFVLQLAPGDYVSAYSDEIKSPRVEYVDGLYKEIEGRWLSTKGDYDAFYQELRAYGGTLLDELVPPGVQDALWSVRDSLTAIQVVAEEPFIPWELVHLKPPRSAAGQPAPLPDESHFLASKGLVRWLHNRPAAPMRLAIRSGHSFYVIPKYPHPDYDLPEAQEEIPYLKRTFGSKEARGDVEAIRTLLRTPGKVDHFHFSGHGEAETQRAVDGQLMLGGTIENDQWIPRFLKADLIAQYAQLMGPDGERPLVLLNACQVGRASWRLSSIGGFAESFIRAHAGVFVGSLWSVGDKAAHTFSEAFYDSLRRGATLAKAAIAGRKAAAKEKEGSWLAYVVYGYPHATVTFPKP